MSITTTVTGPFYEGTGAISLSDIRRNFRARNTDGTFNTDNNSISFSDILRNTDVNATNPVIPDCDQNNGIQASAGVAHSLSEHRGSIKYINVNQTGTDENLDVAGIAFSDALNRNIIKVLTIAGTVGSNDVTQAALIYSGTSRNLAVEITGSILGCGGAADGGNAGAAVSFTESGTNCIINIGSAARVYGGGGGGGDGGNGGSGGNGGLGTFNYGRGNVRCGFGCRGVVAPGPSGGAGGAGGVGGAGQGYNRQSGPTAGTSGSGGGGGSTNSTGAPCGGARSGTSGSGGSGGVGGTGGTWGQQGGTGGNGGSGSSGSPGTGRMAICGGCCPKKDGGCGTACDTPTGGTGSSGSAGGAGTAGGAAGAAITGGGFTLTGDTSSDRVKGSTP